MRTIKHSRQRESILTFLLNRKDHPTADTLYAGIREEYPNISLGTVYRNLNLLVELGEIQKLTCGDGKDHFDADTSPHYHFVCQTCGCVSDLPLPPVDNLDEQAQACTDCHIDSHTLIFYGTCVDCLANPMAHPSDT
ncbi:MAG: transcriptional repressor [Clostridiales bacterium]|nr:transcriptional repressor [Clostridiales bacterium]